MRSVVRSIYVCEDLEGRKQNEKWCNQITILRKKLFIFSTVLAEDRFFLFNVYCISNHKLLYKHIIFKCLL